MAKLNFIQTKAERLVPLDQLIEETEFPETDTVLGGTKGLEVVAERKGDADLNVWKFDKEKALVWLEERVGRVGEFSWSKPEQGMVTASYYWGYAVCHVVLHFC